MSHSRSAKLYPGVKNSRPSSRKFRSVPCLVSDPPWKFHEKPFIYLCNVANTEQTRIPLEKIHVQVVICNIPRMFQIVLVSCPTYHENPIFYPWPLRLKGCRHLHLSVCWSVPIILVNTITQSVYPINPQSLQGGFNTALCWMVL